MPAILLVLSLILTFGVLFVFHACGAKEDGSWMACHWAQQAVAGCGVVLAVISVYMFIVKDDSARHALARAIFPITVLAMSIPGGVIHMCMMESMRCRSVMRPAVLIMGVLIVAAAEVCAYTNKDKD